MKRYDLSSIMETAHRLYKYTYSKRGKTFGEALHTAWSTAKASVLAKESEQRRKEEEARRREEQANEERFISKENIYNRFDIPGTAFYNAYSKGILGAHYVGD